MADFVLCDLDDELMVRLRQRAASHGRTVEAELLDIVRSALMPVQRGSAAELMRLAADIRALSDGRRQTPSELLRGEGRGVRLGVTRIRTRR